MLMSRPIRSLLKVKVPYTVKWHIRDLHGATASIKSVKPIYNYLAHNQLRESSLTFTGSQVTVVFNNSPDNLKI